MTLGVHKCLDLVIATLVWTLTKCRADDTDLCPTLSDTYQMATYKTRCFQFAHSDKTWRSAREYCSQNGGRLAKINDADTQNFLDASLASMTWNTEHMWMGLNDMNDDDTWSWVGKEGDPDEPLTWTGSWLSGYPREPYWYEYGASLKCAIIRKQRSNEWKWKNKNCNYRKAIYRFVCEYEIIQTSSAITTTESQTTTSTALPTTTEPTSTVRSVPYNVTSETQSFSRGTSDVTDDHPGFDAGVKRQTDDNKTEQIPLYAVILAFVAGIAIASTVTAFVVCRKQKNNKRKLQENNRIPDDVYLTTINKDESYVNCPISKRAVSNDYFSEEMEIVKGSQGTAVHKASFNGREGDRLFQPESNPSLEGSMRKGDLPEVPTDGGYEIPVNLRREYHTKARMAASPRVEGNASSRAEGCSAASERASGDYEGFRVSQIRDSRLYEIIPVDDEYGGTYPDDRVYQSVM